MMWFQFWSFSLQRKSPERTYIITTRQLLLIIKNLVTILIRPSYWINCTKNCNILRFVFIRVKQTGSQKQMKKDVTFYCSHYIKLHLYMYLKFSTFSSSINYNKKFNWIFFVACHEIHICYCNVEGSLSWP